MATLNEPKNAITRVPQNRLNCAQFTHEIGSLRNRAASWQDLCIHEVRDLPGL